MCCRRLHVLREGIAERKRKERDVMAALADQVLIVGLSAIAGYGGKMVQDWWTAKRAQKQADKALWSLHKQQFYLPLLGAGRDLKTRLSKLAAVYRGQSKCPFTPTSLSRDFRELYLLSPDEIPDLLASDGNQPRWAIEQCSTCGSACATS
jgi:hypothetical protein